MSSDANTENKEVKDLPAVGGSGLPQGWRTDRDLLVLFGCDHANVAQGLADQGQERIVIYIPKGQPVPTESLFPIVRTHTMLMQHVQNMKGVPPALAHLKLMPGAAVDPVIFTSMGETLTKALKSWYVNRNTLDNFGEVWLKQVVTNMADIAMRPTIDELKDLFVDRPCIVVSPGPSLVKNIEQLKEVGERAVIMTCPHALHALDQAGIVPDIVVIGDAQTLAWQYGDYDFSKIKALVLMASSCPGLFEMPAQRVFTYGFNPAVDLWVYQYVGRQGFLASGGSVACVELSLAVQMGCPQIAFIGQDLAFEGNRYYAASVRDGESTASLSDDGNSFTLERNLPVDKYNHKGRRTIKAREQQVMDVPGYYGDTVKTSHTLSVFLDWFSIILNSDEVLARVFNCTEGGAYIDGMIHVPLARFMQRLPKNELEGIQLRFERAMLPWNKLMACTYMKQKLANIRQDLERCEQTSKNCIRLARGARGNDTKLTRLGKEEMRLSRELKAVPFVSLIAQREIREASEAGADPKSLEDSLIAAERLFQVVLDATRLVKEPLRVSHERL